MKRKIESVQVMLYIILMFLLVFVGVGVYFLVWGITDPTTGLIPTGLLGIGAFLVGFGFILLMQSSMLRTDKDSFKATFAPSFRGFGYVDDYHITGARMKAEVRFSYVSDDNTQLQDFGLVSCFVLDDAVLLCCKSGTNYAIDRGCLSNMQQIGTKLVCNCKMHDTQTSVTTDERVCLQSPSVIQTKALMGAISRLV